MKAIRPSEAIYVARTKWLGKSGAVARMICDECDAQFGIAKLHNVSPDLVGGHSDLDALTDAEKLTLAESAMSSTAVALTKQMEHRQEFERILRENPNDSRLEDLTARMKEMSRFVYEQIAATQVLMRGGKVGAAWLLAHPQSAYRLVGTFSRIITMQRKPDGSPRLTEAGRGTMRRPGGYSERFAHLFAHESRLDAKQILGNEVLLPGAVYCPRCGAPTWVPEPT